MFKRYYFAINVYVERQQLITAVNWFSLGKKGRLSDRLGFCSGSAQRQPLRRRDRRRPTRRRRHIYLLPFLRHRCLDRVFLGSLRALYLQWRLSSGVLVLYFQTLAFHFAASSLIICVLQFCISQFLRWFTTSILILGFVIVFLQKLHMVYQESF